MPLLSAHFDTSVISFFIKKDSKSSEILNFPYVYSKNILSNQCTQQEFYTYVIEKILSERKIKTGSCDILISGFINPPELPLKTKFSIDAHSLVESSEDYIPIVLNNFSFLTKGVVSSFSYCKEGDKKGYHERDMGEFDYYANLCIYPQIQPNDVSAQSDIDENITQRVPSNFKLPSEGKIIFTGGRFAQNSNNKELTYILILETLRGLGVYDVYLDTSNVFLLSQTVKMYDRKQTFPLEDYIDNLGSFVRTGGSAECLLSSGVGDDQFIEIEKDKIFVMPLNLDSPAKLKIKSNALGNLETKTKGGKLGIVFDTRSEDKSIYSDVKIFNDCIKQFSRVDGGL